MSARGEITLERVHVGRHVDDAPEHDAEPKGDRKREEVKAAGADKTIADSWLEIIAYEGLVPKESAPAFAVVSSGQGPIGVKRENGEVGDTSKDMVGG